jgi:MOSC domain-containing protein YiiM/GNAT superfamily N-acetyltransferase
MIAGYHRSMNDGRLLQVNVSPGGVPKLPIEDGRVTWLGIEGDRQQETTVHGGPHRAVSILGIEAIRRVAAEGHPIAPGTTGENLTTEGFDVSTLPAGTRLEIGTEVVLELAGAANPCRTIRHSFADLRFGRLGMSVSPADSRMYARVIREGTVHPGDPIHLTAPGSESANDHLVASRLDDAERSSTLAVWRAAEASGARISLLDDGELAVAAAPDLPGPMFNLGLGFASLPNLLPMAIAHFARHGVTGWVWADEPPWPAATVDSTAVYGARAIDDEAAVPDPDGVIVRELARDEIGPWARIVVEAAELPEAAGTAWEALEPRLALGAHDHRFVAEVDGRAVATGLLHTHHRVGWLRAGTVLPAYRRRGIQGALIAARIERARRLGCDLVGASATAAGSSARNIERAGMRTVATRRRYRVPSTMA